MYIYIYYFLSTHRHSNRKFVARYQLTKLWGKTPTRMEWWAFCPEGIFFLFEHVHKLLLLPMKWNGQKKTILSNVKSLQIPVTKKQMITLQVRP